MHESKKPQGNAPGFLSSHPFGNQAFRFLSGPYGFASSRCREFARVPVAYAPVHGPAPESAKGG